jgi:hypothetical protein
MALRGLLSSSMAHFDRGLERFDHTKRKFTFRLGRCGLFPGIFVTATSHKLWRGNALAACRKPNPRNPSTGADGMSANSWILLDATRNEYLDSLKLDSRELGVAGCAVRKSSLRGGLGEGLDLVEIAAGPLRCTVLPGRGMGIWKLQHAQWSLGWQSPVPGPVHPRFVPLMEPGGLGWLDGFDELLVRCGLSSNGAPEFDSQGRLVWPLHGRIANLPAQQVVVQSDPQAEEIRLTGVVHECRFLFHHLRLTSTVALRPAAPEVRIIDEVANLSAKPGEFELLYHINFGPPLLESGARLVAPVKTLVPRTAHAANGIDTWDTYGPPQAGFAEQVYFFHLHADEQCRTRVLLRNAAGARGVSVAFNRRELPCFTLWKNTQALADGYVTGLEPGVNFPNPRSFEQQQGRVATLAPGESRRFEVRLIVHDQPAAVAEAEAVVLALQALGQPEIHPQPQAGWTIV